MPIAIVCGCAGELAVVIAAALAERSPVGGDRRPAA
jgi:hypothetical protein